MLAVAVAIVAAVVLPLTVELADAMVTVQLRVRAVSYAAAEFLIYLQPQRQLALGDAFLLGALDAVHVAQDVLNYVFLGLGVHQAERSPGWV